MGIDAEMYADIPDTVTPEDVLKVSRRMVDCFGTQPFWLMSSKPSYRDIKMAAKQTLPHALYLIDEESQDSNETPYIKPKKGRQFVKVSLGGRYYGKGYERGDIGTPILIARFLKHHWPDAKCFYGGDSSGVLYDEMTEDWETEILTHLFTVGHEPYRGVMSFTEVGEKTPTCPRCLTNLIRNGTGQGGQWGVFYCNSCDLQLETNDNGKTYTNRKEDSYKAAREFWEKVVKFPELAELARRAFSNP